MAFVVHRPLPSGWLPGHEDNQPVRSSFKPGVALDYRFQRLWIPYWILALATGVPPILWIWRSRRRNARAQKGLCVNCGYDLRATPQRCPECGTAPVSVGPGGEDSE